ncbi:MAG TPA: carbamoyltransferase HypF, partial [Bacteroidales bacterium]|nr:carbamoyltransferase HypF [Bacteroidales bacterium]
VCDDCLRDMKDQEHRIDYPFINCTNCGPRFTIIRGIPYDRPMTTMKPFDMCPTCKSEYNNILDRRFHAQPIACNSCGPTYTLITQEHRETKLDLIFSKLSAAFNEGKLIAMKGLGGYHLACDALNDGAVDRLRAAKNRDGKPFAVMFRDMEAAGQYAHISESERTLLGSWRRPIVLLEMKRSLAKGVSMGFNTIGAMLPYLPFHYLLFEQIEQDVIVLTSGNLSDEPIIISNEEAINRLGPVADLILINDRDIYNRTDDSVTRIVNGKTRMIRRSRSWVPRPVGLNTNVEGILGCGAELVNCFCIGKDKQAMLSQHIGDLKNAETLEFYSESVERFKKLFRMTPTLAVHDLHPDYLSTRYALEGNIPTLAVQHHHAHIAACMAEFGIGDQVIGISFDGVGLGTDGNIWGGEFLLCNLHDFERKFHLDYTKMPGGDKATKEPWRMAVSYLMKVFGDDYHNLKLPFLENLNEEKTALIEQALRSGINSPLTSSTGRLFDAVAALTGLCTTASFHAEAPMRLESIIDINETGYYPFRISDVVDTSPIIEAICDDLVRGIAVPRISARFHNTVINIIFAAAGLIAAETGIRRVVLSGGSFQNKYILERAENGLRDKGYEVFSPLDIPANDGGIALGQLAIAAAMRNKGLI